MKFLAGQRAFDVNFQFHRLALRELVHHAGNRARNARAHQHVIHAGEHRAENRGQGGQLDFFQEVDADESGVAFLREKHFHEIRQHGQRDEVRAGIDRGHGHGLERRVVRLAAGNEIIRHHAGRDAGNGEIFQRAPDVPAGVAHLQPARQDARERGAGDDAKLAGLRNGAGEPPVGDAGAHSALND